MTIALSTGWVGADHPTVEGTIRLAHEAGFTAFEIGAAGVIPPIETLLALKDELGITYTSVHNIARREGLTAEEVRGDGLADDNDAIRNRAIDRTAETVDLARRIGAHAVVIHAGDVPVPKGWEKQDHARTLIEAGRRDEAVEHMRRALAERNELAPKYVEIATASLSEVLRRTGDFPLGCEVRVHYYSIPMPGELAFMRAILARHPIYCWVDTGHARVLENLGLVATRTWMERFRGAIVGMHFHDVQTMSDHHVPGTGDLDFREFVPYLTDEMIKVIELHLDVSVEGIARAKERLEAVGIG